MFELLKMTLKDAPIVDIKGYPYFIHPITDGVPEMRREMLNEVVTGIVSVANLDCDKIVTPEAMGIPVATALSLRTGLPFLIIRKKEYRLPGEVSVSQSTGYSRGTLYINGLKKGDRVVFIDDVISTGGTLRAVVSTLRGMGVVIKDIVVVVEKGGGKAAVEKELGVKIKTLVKVEISDGKVKVLNR